MQYFSDDLYYIHQRPYSIRKVNKRSGGAGQVIREMSVDDRSLFSLKICSRQNQPIPDPTAAHPCQESECSDLCFTIPNPEPHASSVSTSLARRCGCRQGYKINSANGHSCVRDTTVNFYISKNLVCAYNQSVGTHKRMLV